MHPTGQDIKYLLMPLTDCWTHRWTHWWQVAMTASQYGGYQDVNAFLEPKKIMAISIQWLGGGSFIVIDMY